MSDAVKEMTDIVFSIKGRSLPAAYASEIWHAVVHVLPWMEMETYAGILPLRVTEDAEGTLLPQRAKLVLRVPVEFVSLAHRLSGHTLDVGGHALLVGDGKERSLQPSSTLHAHLVASAQGEEEFLAGVAAELQGMGVACKWICGRHMTIAGERPIEGYSLVLHELKPLDSLRVQYVGLGGERWYGCGIFVPYKAIPNLD